MLTLLSEGLCIKYTDKLYDGVISYGYKIKVECDCAIQTNYVITKPTGEPISINEDEIRFVRVMDDNGERYFVSYDILKRYWTGGILNKETIIPRSMYDRWCKEDVIRRKIYGETVTPGRYFNYVERDENTLKEAIDKMYGSRNNNTRFSPKQVLLNGKYTTVVWSDGSHTVVKLAEGEQYDPEKALLYAIVKHLCRDVKARMDRYLDSFDKVTVYKNKSDFFSSLREFLKECDAIDAAGGLNQEYNPDEDETFFDDEEDNNDTE